MNHERKKILPGDIISLLMCVVFIPIIVVNLILIVNSYRNPDELPGAFGVKPAVVLSGSMEPAIETGDLILLHDTDPLALEKGDVICYLSSGKAVTHRIVGITAGEDGRPRNVTQGDANNAEARLPVTPDQVQGIWKGARIGGLGNALLFMQTATGMLLFVICPLILFILWDIWRRHKLDKEEAARTALLEAELEALKAERNRADSEKK